MIKFNKLMTLLSFACVAMVMASGSAYAQSNTNTYGCTDTGLAAASYATYSDSNCSANNTYNQASTQTTSTAVLISRIHILI